MVDSKNDTVIHYWEDITIPLPSKHWCGRTLSNSTFRCIIRESMDANLSSCGAGLKVFWTPIGFENIFLYLCIHAPSHCNMTPIVVSLSCKDRGNIPHTTVIHKLFEESVTHQQLFQRHQYKRTDIICFGAWQSSFTKYEYTLSMNIFANEHHFRFCFEYAFFP